MRGLPQSSSVAGSAHPCALSRSQRRRSSLAAVRETSAPRQRASSKLVCASATPLLVWRESRIRISVHQGHEVAEFHGGKAMLELSPPLIALSRPLITSY